MTVTPIYQWTSRLIQFTTPHLTCDNSPPVALSHVEIWTRIDPKQIFFLAAESEVYWAGGRRETAIVPVPHTGKVQVKMRAVDIQGRRGCWSKTVAYETRTRELPEDHVANP